MNYPVLMFVSVCVQFFTFPMAWIAGQSNCQKMVTKTPNATWMLGKTATPLTAACL